MSSVVPQPGWVLFFSAALTLVGTYYYGMIALKRGIVAKITFRSLHDKLVPRGGGIVLAIIFSLVVALIGASGLIPVWMAWAFGVGGAAAALCGFLDDVHEWSPKAKLAAQLALSLWGFFCLYSPLFREVFARMSVIQVVPVVLLILFLPIWFINIYNFMDGIDGLALSTAVFVSGALALVLTLRGGDPRLIFLCELIVACGAGFLVFNLPPAKLFMGDAGSIFFGYTFIVLGIFTVVSGMLEVWTWMAILGYVLGDTTFTNGYRFLFVEKWYGGHRSHAYQNLARISGSHARVTYGILIYHLAWCLPCAVGTILLPNWSVVFGLAAFLPALAWTWKNGPRLSRE